MTVREPKIRLNTELLYQDFLKVCNRKKISRTKAAIRLHINASAMVTLGRGIDYQPSSDVLLKILYFIGSYDLKKYLIIEETD